MASWCKSIDKSDPEGGAATEVMDGARAVTNLDHVPSPWSSFLRRFKIAYGDLGGISDIRANTEEEEPEKKEKHNFSTEITYLPPKFSPIMALEFVSECFCFAWSTILKAGDDSMVNVLQKLCSKKKVTQRANDFKAKGILDYFGTPDPSLEVTPMLALFGRITGLTPRSKSKGYLISKVRKAWGPVATAVIVVSHCERCWKLGEMKSGDDEPSVSEVRARLNKCANNKQFSVRRSIRLLHILFNSSQPHWMMAPYLGACKEFNSRCPWEAESIARIYHLLFWVAEQVMEHGFTGFDLVTKVEKKAATLWQASGKARSRDEIDFGTTTPMAGHEGAFTFDMVTEEEALSAAGSMHLTAAHLAIALVESWEQECLMINENMTRAVVSSTRRMAVRGVFNPESANITIAEKNCVLKILKWYANNAKREVDWEEARELNLQRVFPFFVPDSLMEKSTAELNHHAENVAIEYDAKKSEEMIHDLGVYSTRQLGEAYTNPPNVSMTRDEMMWEDDRDDLSAAKFKLTKEGDPSTNTRHKPKRLPKGEQEKADLVNNMPPLSTLTFNGPVPVRHPISMTDILDNDADVLRRLRLLNRVAVGPNSPEKQLKLLNDDISGMFSVSVASHVSVATESLASMSIDDTSTIAESVAEDNNSLGEDGQHDDASQGSIAAGNNTEVGFESIATGASPPEQQHQHQHQHQHQQESVQLESSTETNVTMKAIVKRRTNAVALTARGRVHQKIEQKKKGDREKLLKAAQKRIQEYQEASTLQEREAKVQEITQFDLHTIVQDPSEKIDAATEAENMLAAEHAHKRVVMKNGAVELRVVERIANNHFQPWQLMELHDLDMTNSRLGPDGILAIAPKFHAACRLVRLHFGGNHMGESAFIDLLKAISAGGGSNTLQDLDLHGNHLTMVSDGFSTLGEFVNMTHLNLSDNHIAIDNSRHMNLLVASLEPLTKLTHLSIGGNRLQTTGFGCLCSHVFPVMRDLEFLDVSDAFLTPDCYSMTYDLIKSRDPIIKKIVYSGNMIHVEDLPELQYFSKLRDITFVK
jgi:hypothetical protein